MNKHFKNKYFLDTEVEYIIKKACLNDEMATLLKELNKGDKNYIIADKLGYSDSTFYRKTNELWKKIMRVI